MKTHKKKTDIKQERLTNRGRCREIVRELKRETERDWKNIKEYKDKREIVK